MKFRKLPVVIDAIQWDGTIDTMNQLNEWIDPLRVDYSKTPDAPSCTIPTLEGDMIANLGDWVIKGVKGECYPCKPDIFNATYERVE